MLAISSGSGGLCGLSLRRSPPPPRLPPPPGRPVGSRHRGQCLVFFFLLALLLQLSPFALFRQVVGLPHGVGLRLGLVLANRPPVLSLCLRDPVPLTGLMTNMTSLAIKLEGKYFSRTQSVLRPTIFSPSEDLLDGRGGHLLLREAEQATDLALHPVVVQPDVLLAAHPSLGVLEPQLVQVQLVNHRQDIGDQEVVLDGQEVVLDS